MSTYEYHNLIMNYIPGYNCSKCGFSSCSKFIDSFLDLKDNINNIDYIDSCPFIGKGRFINSKKKISDIVSKISNNHSDEIYGIIDNLKADLIIEPIAGEQSCREEIFILDKNIIDLSVNDYISYRPIGCPIVHFAKIINIKNSILTIFMVGPINRIYNLNKNMTFRDVGLAFIIAFEGVLKYGKKPNISQTVKFIPNECMMKKVHKGIVVFLEGNKIRIESIDLKI